MADPDNEGPSRDDLRERIAAARAAAQPPKRRPPGAMRGWELAFRMVLELVVGIAIGGAMGYGIDWLIGTVPAFTLVFGLLGFAAGVRVMLRSAKEVNRPPRGEAEERGEDARSGGTG
jgi:ATP synthase protein I